MAKEIVSQVLPKGQKEIIRKALELQYKAIDGNGLQGDEIEYMKHDIRSLLAFMNYDISVTLAKDMKDKFSFLHGVDFPEYTDVDAKYPIEVAESKWVTIIVGDFSFVDDGVHGRECHVNSIATIKKYLREDMDGVIDDIENNGGSWIVVEDYDGSIEMNHPMKDEREFQVIWLATAYDPTTSMEGIDHFSEDNGYSTDDFNAVNTLGEGEQTTIPYGNVSNALIVLRIK